ncbi:MAG: histidine kinase dimerization/phospho-acceptor domain-containing protein, partial [Pseudomonadota bacterium]
AIGAEALVRARIGQLADGRLRVQYRVFDVFGGQQLVGQQLLAAPPDWRRIAHKIADGIYTALTGDAEALRGLNLRLSEEVEERRRVEAELRAAEAGLREAEKLAALGQMSAAVSHELSQPVAALRTYLAGLRLLLRQQREAEAAETLGHVDRIVERMTAITRELKALARRGGRDEAVPPPVVDLAGAAAA